MVEYMYIHVHAAREIYSSELHQGDNVLGGGTGTVFSKT